MDLVTRYSFAALTCALLLQAAPGRAADAPSVDLSEHQAAALKTAVVQTRQFILEKESVGVVDFNEDLAVAVFPHYPGKIIAAKAQLGDYVPRGKPLYTIDSPDLVAAESTLIAAAAAWDLAKKALSRADVLVTAEGMAVKDFEQAAADEQSAAGALQAAREALRLFGKTPDEIQKLIATRRVDSGLVVTAPISGRITARNAQPGLLVQPGTLPAPYNLADVGTKWLLANIPEADAGLYRSGQTVKAIVTAFPNRVFEGRIERIGATVDPNTHRLTLRSTIQDPQDELHPNMFVDFRIAVGEPIKATAIPQSGVVREADGSLSAWVTTDNRHFTQRTVTVGLQKDGYDQILSGLNVGEKAVVDGAIFLSNMLTASPAD